ncbi:hypothetical protein B0I35DRAFT_277844 [Stachybotrys elegans]|uniref:Uncharacterized protein n=1 Tax=Stachybotrys elegans TaxID=80388 RepID=A0A8K0WP64_9HYPO|nr:hypothetical protein B0I35DRAFT_277844 [Stachybotrys elegans]
MEGVNCFDDERCLRWQQTDRQDRRIEAELWNHGPAPGNVSFQWVDTKGALSAVFHIPYAKGRVSPSEDALLDESARQGFYVGACSFVGRWVPSSASAILAVTDVVESNVMATFFAADSMADAARTGFSARLTKDWADLLHASTPGSTTGSFNKMSSALDGLLEAFISRQALRGNPEAGEIRFFLPLAAKTGSFTHPRARNGCDGSRWHVEGRVDAELGSPSRISMYCGHADS